MAEYESDNDFEVDEPEILQENSDDDWAPAKNDNKRTSIIGKRGGGGKRKKDDDEDSKPKKKGPGRKPKAPAKKKPSKVNGVAKSEEVKQEKIAEEEDDDEGEFEDDDDQEEKSDEVVPKEFRPGAFIVLKTDFDKDPINPPLWRIDGKSLVQKYLPEEKNGVMMYKSTISYGSWNINNKDKYYPAVVTSKLQSGREHFVELQKDSIQKHGTANGK